MNHRITARPTLRSRTPLRTLVALGGLAFALQVSAQTEPTTPPQAPPQTTPPAMGAGPAQPGGVGPAMAHRPGRAGERPMPGSPDAGPRGLRGTPVFANVEATVTGYLLSPEAEVAGLMLDNGRQVRVPPHLGSQLAELVKPGQRVRVDNSAATNTAPKAAPTTPPAPDLAAAPMPPMPAALTITAIASGRQLVGTPPAPGAMPPAPRAFGQGAQGQAALQPMKASGTVKQVLTGPRGETRGVLLDNGTQVAIPPHAGPQTAPLLAMGTRINVEGYGRTSTYGTALQATSVGRPGETPVTMYAAPLPR